MMYETMKKQELKDLCKERGLKTTGNVSTLISRLTEADRAAENAKADAGKGVGADRKEDYAVNAMAPALKAANKTNNRHAITEDDAFEAGVDSERFSQWKIWCEDLHEIVDDYVIKKRSRSSNDKERAAARSKIYPAWRTMLKVGEEDLLSPKMYLREDDVESLVGFCEDFVGTAAGTEQASATKTKFRKLVETLIGCRMKGCETLPKDDRDLVILFENAVRSRDNADKALNGNEKVKGIYADLEAVKKSLEELKTSLYNLGAAEETINELTAGLRNRQKELNDAKIRSEKAKAKAEATISTNQKAYDEIIARITVVDW